jgi:hypothetical protein
LIQALRPLKISDSQSLSRKRAFTEPVFQSVHGPVVKLLVGWVQGADKLKSPARETKA